MKKTVSFVLALLMMFSCVMALSGCKEKETIVGDWESTVNLAPAMNKGFEEMGPEFADCLSTDAFNLKLKFTFKEDGTYEINIDKDSADAALASYKETASAGLKTYLQETLKEELDEMLAMVNMTLDEYVDAAFAQLNIESIGADLDGEGKYEFKDGKLFTSESLDEEINEKEYESCELNGDELKLLEAFGAEDNDMYEFMKDLYPITLKKVK